VSPLRFVDVGGRRVAWRCTGAGPAAVLLHGSPQSSRALNALGVAVARAGLTAIMPDTPGAGASAALGDEISIDDLAEALCAFVDAIGLRRFSLYGSHTGAALAVAFAARHPHRVTGLVLDGIAAWTDSERAQYHDHYAPPFLPRWDGAHMTWLWSRMEAQSLFFPWHVASAATWRGVDLSSPAHLHRNAMDMLESGDAYRAIYRASLAYDPADALTRVGAPMRIMTLATDVLAAHASRPALRSLLKDLFDDPPSLHRAVAVALAAWPGDPPPALGPASLFRRGRLNGAGRVLVALHPAGASSRVFARRLTEQKRPMIAFDLPGHGFSGGALPDSVETVAATVNDACLRLGVTDYEVCGDGFGAVVARALQAPHTDRAPHPDGVRLAQSGAVSLAPEWDGGHLLRAWRVAYRMALWSPWYDNTAAAARMPAGDLAPAAIQDAAVDLLRAGANWIVANRLEAQADQAG
jgi:pimeloyl-ACP methyl ester carboxylesterase